MFFSRGIFTILCVVIIGFATHATVHASEEPLAKGVVIPRVVCIDHPEQSYALYLPSNYSPEGKWPILYIFDPGARGSMPVILAKDAAEKFGYIVMGSNNSRNGQPKLDLDAANAIWDDAHRRFTIDERRVYFAGLSGGARLATALALGCHDCAAGVISSGAGFPLDQPPSAQAHFSYFATIGMSDFNYPEAVVLAHELDQLNLPHRLRRFDGSHEWAPAELWFEALAWMNLLAMRQDRLARDPEFISQQFEAETQRAQELEKRGEIYAAWQEYRSVASDFAGLRDVASITKHVEDLNHSPSLQNAEKQEKEALKEQLRLEGPIISGMAALAQGDGDHAEIRRQLQGQSAESQYAKEQQRFIRPTYSGTAALAEGDGDQAEIRHQLLRQIAELRDAKERERNEDRRRILGRALGEVLTGTYESAEDRMRAGDAALASMYFELASEASPKEPWLLIGIARAQAQLGHRKDALDALRRARGMGLNAESRRGIFRDNAEFTRYRNDPDFLKLLEDSSAKH
jgi:pimeloyl-ACP methyl ester carboxylesterase